MSRIGKKPVLIPKGVTVSVKDSKVAVKGPKGELARAMPKDITVKVEGDKVVATRQDDSRPSRARHGLVRALINNMVHGVTQGFSRELEINGVGYKAEVKGKAVLFTLGYSHTIDFPLPAGIEAKMDKNRVILTGVDRELLGHVAAKVRSLRPPEPYKGKGIKYKEEHIRRKVGKTGAGT
ncbi:MAG TPA: 50S ribosomal protein L6 [Polyangia bacterium]|nr:50S ribosomal protein L6 [Polyangia bacterium]